jgi:hypothetical protein
MAALEMRSLRSNMSSRFGCGSCITRYEQAHRFRHPRDHFMTLTTHSTNSAPRNYMSSYSTYGTPWPGVGTAGRFRVHPPPPPTANTDMATRARHRLKKIKRCNRGVASSNMKSIQSSMKMGSSVQKLRGQTRLYRKPKPFASEKGTVVLSALKTLCFSETLVNAYESNRHHNPEDPRLKISSVTSSGAKRIQSSTRVSEPVIPTIPKRLFVMTPSPSDTTWENAEIRECWHCLSRSDV